MTPPACGSETTPQSALFLLLRVLHKVVGWGPSVLNVALRLLLPPETSLLRQLLLVLLLLSLLHQ